MRKWIILLFLLNVLIVSAGERANLVVGESFLIDNKNITLIRSDDRNNAAVFCVNGQRGIVREDSVNSINGVYIELKSIDMNFARIEVDYDCYRCPCGDECNNNACFEVVEDIDLNGDGEISDDEIILVGENPPDETIVEPEGVGVQGVVIAILVILVLLLGVVVLWKRS